MRKIIIIVFILGITFGLYLRHIFDDQPAAAKIVTIRSRNIEYQLETRAETVGEMLEEQGHDVIASPEATAEGRGNPNEIASPSTPRNDKIISGQVISISKPLHVTIQDGGNESQSIITTAETVGDLLREQKIGLARTDRVTPDQNSYLAENVIVQIDRIVDLEVVERTDIPFSVSVEHDPSSYYGREEVLVAGRNGVVEQKFLITYQNGVEKARRLLSETVLAESASEKRRLGTRIDVERTEEGRASWYAYKACLCAAHPTYLKGRFVRVTAVNSGKSVIVKINDRGPEQDKHPDRVIDLDAVAFRELAPLGAGTIAVRAELLRQ